jgi:hypothetical protein
MPASAARPATCSPPTPHADHHEVLPPRHGARLLWRALGGVHPAMISTGLSKQRQTVTSMTHLRL